MDSMYQFSYVPEPEASKAPYLLTLRFQSYNPCLTSTLARMQIH